MWELVFISGYKHHLYVTPDRVQSSDSRPGSQDKPCKSLNHAVSFLLAGETLHIGSGDYPGLPNSD
ncbi:hypothetical protein GF407_10490 [candidate division KSB1 bacterium]|nr:hypothetical protein [candidate division KSB1 bacterium]